MSVKLNSLGKDMLKQFLLDFKGEDFVDYYLDSNIDFINYHITEMDWYKNEFVFSIRLKEFDTYLDHNGQAKIVFTRNEMEYKN